ncbi:Retrovirus-related Pol poly from transposon opus, partial [Paramuricea clavata]
LKGNHYLVMVDGFSGFPFIKRLKSLKSKAIINALKAWFLDWGNPKTIRSDGGPQFRSEFGIFCAENCIVHELSSPYNSRSNGTAEAAVKIAKNLLIKCDGNWDEFTMRLREMRNIPRGDGNCPAEMLLGRKQRGFLPTIMESFDNPITEKKEKKRNIKEGRKLKPLSMSERVLIQNPITKKWDESGIVLSERKH